MLPIGQRFWLGTSGAVPISASGVRGLRTVALLLCASILNVRSQESELWGQEGSKYDSKGRLLDWSYAGYAAGEAAIPSPPVTASVHDYGAKGDGTTDDTAAFIAAVGANEEGVLFIPEGRYVIRGFINITSRLSLRGAGSKLTTLVFPNSLAALYGQGGSNRTDNATQWSFGVAFISYQGKPFHDESTYVGNITKFAQRGTNTLQVSNLNGLKVGAWVSVVIGNPRKTGKLFRNMNMGLDHGCTADARCFDSNLFSFQSRVAALKGLHTLVLERPLPYNISTAFAPAAVHRWAPQLANVGVEGMSFEMMSSKYKGHFKEEGFNALQLNNTSNAWVRDVVFNGTDLALNVFGCSFITVTNVTATAPAGRAGANNCTGHHALFSVRTSDTIFSHFNIDTKFIHDLTVDFFSRGVVWSEGRGVDMNLDHHKAQTYGILWTQLDLGLAKRPFESGGSKGRGLDAGSLTTMWNINASAATRFGRSPPADFGPALNFIGCGPDARYPSLRLPLTSSWWVEYMSPDDLQPANIFLAQQALRLASDNRVSTVLGGKGQGGDLLTLY